MPIKINTVITIFLRTGLPSRVNEIAYKQYNDNNHRYRQYPLEFLFHAFLPCTNGGEPVPFAAVAFVLFVLPLIFLFLFSVLRRIAYALEYGTYTLEDERYQPHDELYKPIQHRQRYQYAYRQQKIFQPIG